MKAVCVKWIDSHEVVGWTPVELLPAADPKEVVTIGWEVERSDAAIIVASSRAHDPKQVCGAMIIPTESILKVEEIEL